MKKFKHKTTGYIATETNSEKNYKVSEPKNFTIPKWIVENSEDWEEVKEFPKIVSFRAINVDKTVIKISTDGYFNNYSLDSMLHINGCVDSGHFEIYQVAVSESEIFTLGDKVIDGNNPNQGSFTILGFEYEPSPNDKEKHTGVITLLHDHKVLGKWLDLTKLKKAPEPLFTTEDGVDIYYGDDYLLVRSDFTLHHELPTHSDNCGDPRPLKAFSSYTIALQYIDENKPKYSKKEIQDALSKVYLSTTNGTFINEGLFKQCLGI